MLKQTWGRFLLGCFFFFLCGCATVKLDTHITGTPPPILKGDVTGEKVLVLWGTAWRKNQKEAARREELASQAIEEFFKNALGHELLLQKTIGGKPARVLSDSQIMQSDEVRLSRVGRVIILRVEELGPTLSFYLSPILWEGSTDVSFRVRVLDVPSTFVVSDVEFIGGREALLRYEGHRHLKKVYL